MAAALTATVLPARGRGIAESMDGHTLVPSKTSRMSVGSRTQAWNLLREGQLGLFPPEAPPLPPLGPPWGWPPSPCISFSLLHPRCRTMLCVDLQSVQGGPQGHAAFAAEMLLVSLASAWQAWPWSLLLNGQLPGSAPHLSIVFSAVSPAPSLLPSQHSLGAASFLVYVPRPGIASLRGWPISQLWTHQILPEPSPEHSSLCNSALTVS